MRSLFAVTALLSGFALIASPDMAAAQSKRNRPAAAPATPVQSQTYAPAPAPAAAVAPLNVVDPVPRTAEPVRGSGGGFTWDGFFDVEARIPSKETIGDRGFSLNDAALYVTKDFGRALGVIDLPFASSGAGNDFAFGNRQAQAYIQFPREALTFRLGQYDTFYGIEQNDSRYRFFANAGLIKTALIPLTHTGALVTWTSGELSLRGQVANPSNQGLMGGNNPEFGVHGRWDNQRFYAALGLAMNESKIATTANKSAMLVDVTGGATFDRVRLDGEFAYTKTPGTDKAGNAFGVIATYQQDDQLSFGGRLEYLKDAATVTTTTPPTVGLVESALGVSVGPAYKLDQNITLRGDVSLLNTKNVSAAGVSTDDSIFGLTFSVLASL